MLVEDSQLIHIIEAVTSKETWTILADYNQKSSLSRKVYLRKRLFKLSLSENGNMEEHIVEFLSIKNQLAAIGKKFEDDDLAAMLLSSLPDSYSTLVTTLENRPEKEITLEFVKGKLIEEYRRRGEKLEEGGVEMAMKVQTRLNKSAIECFWCHQKGHFKRECPGYTAWLEKQEKRGEKANYAADTMSVCKDDYCFHFKESIGRKNAAEYDKWLIDSGASNHVAINRGFFEDLSVEENFMILPNQAEAKIVGKGSGRIRFWLEGNKQVKISEVRYVPSFSTNVLSVKALLRKGFEVAFRHNKCEISKDRQIIAVAEEQKDV